MANDLIDRVILLVAIIVFSWVALRPDWFIKIASYGKYELRDINSSLLRATRIVAGVSAVWGAAYLVWTLISR